MNIEEYFNLSQIERAHVWFVVSSIVVILLIQFKPLWKGQDWIGFVTEENLYKIAT